MAARPGTARSRPRRCISGTTADGTWSASFSSATDRVPAGQDIYVRVGNGGNAPTTAVPAQHAYARDDGDILQQYARTGTTSIPPPPPTARRRFVTFNVAFQVLVKGRIITLKLGGGGAQGNSGNYQGLDLDTNSSWPTYACYPTAASRTPPTRCSTASARPYAIGDPVDTQTGNFAGQVDQRPADPDRHVAEPLDAATNPPPDGDPRWMSLILVPPLTFPTCNGTCTTHVVGFGSFYITDWSGQAGQHPQARARCAASSGTGPSAINQYSTTCNDPSGICLAERRADAVGRIAHTQSEEAS